MSGTYTSVGLLVKSTAGRDLGQIYIVVGAANGSQLLLADGRERKMAKPKKKNIRHVKALDCIAESVAKKLEDGREVTDEELRRALNSFAKPDNL